MPISAAAVQDGSDRSGRDARRDRDTRASEAEKPGAPSDPSQPARRVTASGAAGSRRNSRPPRWSGTGERWGSNRRAGSNSAHRTGGRVGWGSRNPPAAGPARREAAMVREGPTRSLWAPIRAAAICRRSADGRPSRTAAARRSDSQSPPGSPGGDGR